MRGSETWWWGLSGLLWSGAEFTAFAFCRLSGFDHQDLTTFPHCTCSNYMVDMPWLLEACPALLTAEHLVMVHGGNETAPGLQEAAMRAGEGEAFGRETRQMSFSKWPYHLSVPRP